MAEMGDAPATAVALANTLVIQHILARTFGDDVEGLRAMRDACLAEQEALYQRQLNPHQHMTAQIGLTVLEGLFGATEGQIERDQSNR
jgi:hypothetical protein